MNFDLKEIFCPSQSEEVPFIGNLMSLDLMEFDSFEVNSKRLKVTSVSFDGNKLQAELALTADFGTVPAGYDCVIVAVNLLIRQDGINEKEIPAVWKVLGQLTNLREILIDIEVAPGPVLVQSFSVMTIDDFVAIQCIPTSLSTQFQYYDYLSVAMSRIERLEKVFSYVAVKDYEENIAKFQTFCWSINNFVKRNVSKDMSNLTSDNWVFATYNTVKMLMWVSQQIESGTSLLAVIEKKYARKMEIIKFLAGKQVKYVRNIGEYEKFLRSSTNLFVLFISLNGWFAKKDVVEKFLRLKDGLPGDFVAVDLDLVAVNGANPYVIKSYRNSFCTSHNMLSDAKNVTKTLAKCVGRRNTITPKSRGILDIPCPGFQSSSCPNVSLKWVCYDCQSQLYYGFDKNVYCYCGGAAIDQFKFRCGRDDHHEFIPIKNLSVLDSIQLMEALNIIVLGQSGVGKSTWINAFVNYMAFTSLEEAKNSEMVVAIPAKFSVTDQSSFKNVDVVCGNYEVDENLKTGESATQNCKEYNIIFENKIVNLIDTPGLGDTRGIDEDKKNIKKILDHLRQVDVIHGICLILKPNEARITVLLKYCLKEILSNLHKTSSENLIFCFTHARSTFYRAGETLPTLQALLTEIGVSQSCLDRSFHMDNEAFRFLCCQSANIKFTNEEELSFAESWDRSAEATRNILDAISMMVPHRTSETLSLNRSRNIILNLIPFMVEISENIERNLQQLENQQKLISTHQGTLDELKNQRFTTQIDLVRQTLDHPRTVCVDEECVQYKFLPRSGERQAIYKTHCHPHCGLSGRTPDVYPNPELQGCWAMQGTSHCRICNCSWEIHMHIWYEQTLVEKLVKDDDVERKINEYHDSNALKADLIAANKNQIAILENEKKTVISNCAKFACFLKGNAIVAYNDSFLDYLEMNLRTLENLTQKTNLDIDRIKKMKTMRKLYTEEKKLFDDAAEQENVAVTIQDVSDGEKKLYDLPVHGKQLQIIMKAAINNQKSAPRDSSYAKTIVAPTKKRGIGKYIAKAASIFGFVPRSESSNHSESYGINKSYLDAQYGVHKKNNNNLNISSNSYRQ